MVRTRPIRAVARDGGRPTRKPGLIVVKALLPLKPRSAEVAERTLQISQRLLKHTLRHLHPPRSVLTLGEVPLLVKPSRGGKALALLEGPKAALPPPIVGKTGLPP